MVESPAENVTAPGKPSPGSPSSAGGHLPPPPARPTLRLWAESCLVALVLLAMTAVVLVRILTPRAPVRDLDERVAEEFVTGLRFGQTMGEKDGRTGYAAAYSLLTDRLQSEISEVEFVESFDDLVARYGLLEAAKKTTSEWGDYRRRGMRYHLIYTGTQGRRVTVPIDLELLLADGAYRVDDYTVREPVPEGR